MFAMRLLYINMDLPMTTTTTVPVSRLWRASVVNFSDDVDSCLRHLHYLDEDIIQHSNYYFDRNMLKLTEDGLEALIGWGSNKMAHRHKDWMRSYYISVGQDARGTREELLENL